MSQVMDRYHGPVICGHCGQTFPCATLQRLCPPYCWPAGTTARARIDYPQIRSAG